MKLFKKKEKTMTDTEAKKKAEINRSHSGEISAKLTDAKMLITQMCGKESTEPFEEDVLIKYIAGINELVKKVEALNADVNDMERIDVILKNIVINMKDDLSQKNVETVHYEMKALTWGIVKGKVKIYSEEEEKVRAEINSRVEYLKRYEDLITYARQLDSINHANKKQQSALVSVKKDLEDAKSLLRETNEKNPGLQERLDKIRPGESVPADVQDYANLRNSVVNFFNNINHINSVISINNREASQVQDAIYKMKNQMEQMENMISDELIKAMQESNEAYRKFRLEQQDRIIKLQNVTDEFNSIMESITSSRKFIDNIIEGEERYKKMMREIEKKEEADARGRQLLQEQQLQKEQQVNEQENKRIILN